MTTSYNCPTCGKSHDTLDGLRIHATRQHKLASQQLHDILYPNRPSTCQCGAPVKFITLQKGYQRHCLPCSKKWGADKAAASRRANYKPAWNHGKTKHNDTSVQKISHRVKEAISQRESGHWNLGKTKENDPTTFQAALKRSQSVKQAFKDGRRVAWHKGLSKSNNPSLQKMSTSMRYAQLKSVQRGTHWSTSQQRQRICLAISDAQRFSFTELQDKLQISAAIWDIDYQKAYQDYSENKRYYHVTCHKCKSSLKRTLKNIMQDDACPICSGSSKWQRQIHEHLQGLGYHCLMNDRTIISPKEIDINIPQYNFGIECHGLYWHSDLHEKDPLLCTKKLELSLQRGWKLIQLYEDEWQNTTMKKRTLQYIASLFRPFDITQHKHVDDDLWLTRNVYVHCDESLLHRLKHEYHITKVHLDTTRHSLDAVCYDRAWKDHQAWWTDFSKRTHKKQPTSKSTISAPPLCTISC